MLGSVDVVNSLVAEAASLVVMDLPSEVVVPGALSISSVALLVSEAVGATLSSEGVAEVTISAVVEVSDEKVSKVELVSESEVICAAVETDSVAVILPSDDVASLLSLDVADTSEVVALTSVVVNVSPDVVDTVLSFEVVIASSDVDDTVSSTEAVVMFSSGVMVDIASPEPVEVVPSELALESDTAVVLISSDDILAVAVNSADEVAVKSEDDVVVVESVGSEILLAMVASGSDSEEEEATTEAVSEVKLSPDSIVVGEAPVVTIVTV